MTERRHPLFQTAPRARWDCSNRYRPADECPFKGLEDFYKIRTLGSWLTDMEARDALPPARGSSAAGCGRPATERRV